MSGYYSKRAIYEKEVNEKGEVEEVMIYLDEEKNRALEPKKLSRYMLSTDMYIDSMERPLYQCDLLEVEGIDEIVMIEFRKDWFGFALMGMDTYKYYDMRSNFEKITKFLGTYYDDKVVDVIGEELVTF